MTRSNPSLWPPGSTLCFYKRRSQLIVSFKDRRLDLADTLMLNWSKASRTIYLGIARNTSGIETWDEQKVSKIEDRIRFDLASDCYHATINRLTAVGTLPLHEEFLWKLRIRA